MIVLRVLEVIGVAYAFLGVWFGIALAGQFIADALDRRAQHRRT